MVTEYHDQDTNETSTKRESVHRLNENGDVVIGVDIAKDVKSLKLQVCLFRNLH